MNCLSGQRPRTGCATWDYSTCFQKTEILISKYFGQELWKSSFREFFENYQHDKLYVPQRHLYYQWDFICRLRKTLKRTKQWALSQCLQPDDYIVIHSFMFMPLQEHLYWFFVQQNEPLQYIDLVKHMICSMNKMLVHLKRIHFPEDDFMYYIFQQNITIWFTSFNVKRISLDLHSKF